MISGMTRVSAANLNVYSICLNKTIIFVHAPGDVQPFPL